MSERSDLRRLEMRESERASAGHLGDSHCSGQTKGQLVRNSIGNVGGTNLVGQILFPMDNLFFWWDKLIGQIDRTKGFEFRQVLFGWATW